MPSLSLFVQLRVPSCKRAVLWDVFFPLAAEGVNNDSGSSPDPPLTLGPVLPLSWCVWPASAH